MKGWAEKLIVGLLIIAVSSLFACAPPKEEVEKKKTPEAEKALTGKVVLTASSLSDEHILPYMVSKTGGNYPIGYAMYSGPNIKSPETGRPMPDLCKSWELSKDGLTWTFKLRKDITFHNGTPCTAKDLKYGIEMSAKKGVPNRVGMQYRKLNGEAEILDKYTLAVHFKKPWLWLPNSLYMNFIPMPKEYTEKVGIEGFKKNPVGTGPFKYVESVTGDHWTFEGYKGYYGDGPFIKDFVIKIVPEVSTRLAMLKGGTADIADKMVGVSVKEIRKDPNLRVISSPGTGCLWVFFCDITEPGSPFSKRKVRLACNYAVNKKGICKGVFYGEATPKAGLLFPAHREYEPGNVDLYPYNPEKAKQLLAEAGYPDGFETTLRAGKGGSCPFGPETAEAVAAQLSEVGIETEFIEVEPGVYWGKFRDREFSGLAMHMTTVGWGGMFKFRYFKTGYMYSYNSNPYYDKQLRKAEAELDPEKRKEILLNLEKWMIEEEVGLLPILHGNAVFGVGPRIAEWHPSVGETMPSRFNSIKLK